MNEGVHRLRLPKSLTNKILENLRGGIGWGMAEYVEIFSKSPSNTHLMEYSV